MKKIFSLLLSVLIFQALTAQTPAKKYVLLEQITNSRCSICKSKNPAFRSLIGQAQYADDVHHIAYHPSFPFNTCVFYLANPTENNARAAVYAAQSTPQLALNGEHLSPIGPLLPEATLQAALGQTSPVYLRVTETAGAGAERVATINVHTVGEVPSGYKLYAALVEKTINLTTPNGELVHYNVFRKMLPDINGVPFTPATLGQSVTFAWNYTLNPVWNPNEMYVVAFLQNPTTKDVLNSGTKFDPAVSATGEVLQSTALRIVPNPVSDQAFATIGDDQAEQVEIFGSNGQRAILRFSSEQNTVSFPTTSLTPGLYFLKITGKKGVYTGKMVKN